MKRVASCGDKADPSSSACSHRFTAFGLMRQRFGTAVRADSALGALHGHGKVRVVMQEVAAIIILPGRAVQVKSAAGDAGALVLQPSAYRCRSRIAHGTCCS